MSYATRQYDTTDLVKITRFVREFPFAILMPNLAPMTYAMTPLLIHPNAQNGEMPLFFGHLDRANPALEAMAMSPGKVRCLFMGPNGYISSNDYVAEKIPTWNYASVEIDGEVSLVRSGSETLQLMKHQIQSLEGGNMLSIDFDSPKVQHMMNAIRFFKIKPVSVIGRFKFSQEKPLESRLKAAQRLREKSIRKLERQLPYFADLEPQTAGLPHGN